MEENRFEDLPLKTDPAPVVGPLRAEAPSGTTFNKRTVMITAAIVGSLFAFGILMAFSPKQKKAVTTAQTQEQPTYQVTPEQITEMPSTYNQKNTGNYPQLGPPTPVLPGSGYNQYGDYSGYGYPGSGPTYVVPEPRFVNEEDQPYDNSAYEQQNEIRKSPIRFNVAKASEQPVATQNSTNYDPYLDAMALNNQIGMMEQQKHPQDEKREFMAANHNTGFYAKSSIQAPISKYEIKAGTIIPAVLITGVNSDLPGYITARVRENVYDTVTGKHLLIPQGTRIIGVYDSKIQYGQNRVMTVWTRLIYPNGKSLDLENMTGIDQGGYAGFKDKVNNHWGKLISGALVTSVLSAGAKVATGDPDDDSYEHLAAQGAAENIANVGAKATEKNLNIQPTIEIRPGYRFNLFVQKDFVLAPYKP